MANSEEKIEQLWYTSSDVGLGSIVGFRVRAVSPNLTMIYSDRVRGMDRYTRYALPWRTDPTIAPSSAPISLIYTHTTWNDEAIIAQKKYTGAEGIDKRYGNFFSHLYGLGTIDYKQFSAEDAVWLWGANIWQDNDRSLDRRSTTLPQESLATLIQAGRQLTPDYRSVSQYLSFFIEAYLTRKPKEPIYIAAHADSLSKMIFLLAGLTCCIPLVLFKDLTFSTFESDIVKATTQIVGTNWVPGQPPPPDFTPQLYRDKLALNCDTGEYSQLDHHPRVTSNPLNNPLARQFAQYATNWLLINGSSDTFDDFDALLKTVDFDENLTVEGFLKLFREEIQNVQITREKIITYLNNPVYRIEKLSESGFRNSIISFVTDPSDPSWYETSLRPLLGKLCRESVLASAGMSARNAADSSLQAIAASPQGRGPRRRRRGQATTIRHTLPEVLSSLAKDASMEMVRHMQQVGAGSYGATMQDTHISMLLDVVESCLSDDAYKVWPALLQTLKENQAALTYLTRGSHQTLQFRLLHDLDTPSSDVSIAPLLVFPWSSLGEFLKQGFRNSDWNIIALNNLMQRQKELTPEIARSFGRYQETLQLFTQLTARPETWSIAGSFAALLYRNGYTGKLDYAGLFGLLVTNNVFEAAKDLAIALLQTGDKVSNAYKQQLWTLLHSLLQSGQGLDLVDAVVKSDYFQKKELVNLLLNSSASPHDLKGVLERAYQVPSSELADFFVKKGRNYLASDAQRRDMLEIFVALLSYPGKMERLEVLLDASMDETYVLDILQQAALTPEEQYTVLVRHGKFYLESYMQAPRLAKYVANTYTSLLPQIESKQKFLLALFTPNTHPEYVKTFLKSITALTIPEQREFLDRYGVTYAEYYRHIPEIQQCLAEYVKHVTVDDLENSPFLKMVRQNPNPFSPMVDNVQHFMTVYRYIINPSVRKEELNNLAAALFYLDLPNYSVLTTKLAQAFVQCISNVEEIRSIVEMVNVIGIANNINKEQLLYAMAEQVSRGVQAGNENLVAQYLFYALDEAGRKAGQKSPIEDALFTTVFLDTLLDHSKVTDANAWRTWDASVKGWPLSSQAKDVWHSYLQKKEVSAAIEGKGATRRAPSKGSKPTSMDVSSQAKAPTLSQRIWSWYSSRWPWSKNTPP